MLISRLHSSQHKFGEKASNHDIAKSYIQVETSNITIIDNSKINEVNYTYELISSLIDSFDNFEIKKELLVDFLNVLSGCQNEIGFLQEVDLFFEKYAIDPNEKSQLIDALLIVCRHRKSRIYSSIYYISGQFSSSSSINKILDENTLKRHFNTYYTNSALEVIENLSNKLYSSSVSVFHPSKPIAYYNFQEVIQELSMVLHKNYHNAANPYEEDTIEYVSYKIEILKSCMKKFYEFISIIQRSVNKNTISQKKNFVLFISETGEEDEFFNLSNEFQEFFSTGLFTRILEKLIRFSIPTIENYTINKLESRVYKFPQDIFFTLIMQSIIDRVDDIYYEEQKNILRELKLLSNKIVKNIIDLYSTKNESYLGMIWNAKEKLKKIQEIKTQSSSFINKLSPLCNQEEIKTFAFQAIFELIGQIKFGDLCFYLDTTVIPYNPARPFLTYGKLVLIENFQDSLLKSIIFREAKKIKINISKFIRQKIQRAIRSEMSELYSTSEIGNFTIYKESHHHINQLLFIKDKILNEKVEIIQKENKNKFSKIELIHIKIKLSNEIMENIVQFSELFSEFIRTEDEEIYWVVNFKYFRNESFEKNYDFFADYFAENARSIVQIFYSLYSSMEKVRVNYEGLTSSIYMLRDDNANKLKMSEIKDLCEFENTNSVLEYTFEFFDEMLFAIKKIDDFKQSAKKLLESISLIRKKYASSLDKMSHISKSIKSVSLKGISLLTVSLLLETFASVSGGLSEGVLNLISSYMGALGVDTLNQLIELGSDLSETIYSTSAELKSQSDIISNIKLFIDSAKDVKSIKKDMHQIYEILKENEFIRNCALRVISTELSKKGFKVNLNSDSDAPLLSFKGVTIFKSIQSLVGERDIHKEIIEMVENFNIEQFAASFIDFDVVDFVEERTVNTIINEGIQNSANKIGRTIHKKGARNLKRLRNFSAV